MTAPRSDYELSPEADQDIEEIFDYTTSTFGFDQAIAYATSLEEGLLRLVANPKLGPKRTDIRKGLRSIVINSPIVFYRIIDDRIRVVRILHGSRDLAKFVL